MIDIFINILIVHLIYFHIIAVTYDVWMHKGYFHDRLSFSKSFDHIGRFIMWTLGLGTFSQWLRISAGTHRSHHRHSDTIEDSHSPHHISFLGILDNRFNPYFKRVTNQELGQLATDVPDFDDWIQRNIYNGKFHWGWVVPIALYTIFFGWVGLIAGIVLMIITNRLCMPMMAAWIPHKIGLYRHPKHKFPDKSLNLFPIGIYLSGGELHSNHHYDPQAINLRMRWFEFDISYWYIKLFELLGFLKIKDRTTDWNNSLHK
jgi:stearoyl-CoA desaturase (delta-9 desaturase)